MPCDLQLSDSCNPVAVTIFLLVISIPECVYWLLNRMCVDPTKDGTVMDDSERHSATEIVVQIISNRYLRLRGDRSLVLTMGNENVYVGKRGMMSSMSAKLLWQLRPPRDLRKLKSVIHVIQQWAVSEHSKLGDSKIGLRYSVNTEAGIVSK